MYENDAHVTLMYKKILSLLIVAGHCALWCASGHMRLIPVGTGVGMRTILGRLGYRT
jgi:hypothetical protein